LLFELLAETFVLDGKHAELFLVDLDVAAEVLVLVAEAADGLSRSSSLRGGRRRFGPSACCWPAVSSMASVISAKWR
jgi:hypothetical protein